MLFFMFSFPSFAGQPIDTWIVFGDSISVGFCGPSVCKDPSYIQIVNSESKKHEFRNAAYVGANSGEYSEDFGLLNGPTCSPRVYREARRALIDVKPAGVILAVGGADVQGLSTDKLPCVNYYGLIVCQPFTSEEYRDNLLKIIDYLRNDKIQSSAPIFLISPLPRPGNDLGTPLGDRILDYRQKQLDICSGLRDNVFCVDLYSVIDPSIHFVVKDPLHPTNTAHRLMADAVEKALDLAGY
jgi:lysophospholipase L1-like esterase